MRQYLKQWCSPAIALLTAVAVFSTSTAALAQNPIQGQGKYQAENVNGQNLQTSSSYMEARLDDNPNGALLRVWRGENDNQVWMAFEGGDNFRLGQTMTMVAPTVVPYQSNSYMVFHTGTNGNIYYAVVAPPDAEGVVHWNGVWTPIPNQTSNDAVSVTRYNSSGDLYLVYRGSNGDSRVYGTWLDGNGWHFGGNIGGGEIIGSPGITYNPVTSTLWAVGTGLNSQVWYTSQPIGSGSWPNWRSLFLETSLSPRIAANSDGNMVLTWGDSAQRPLFQAYSRFLTPFTSQTQDSNPIVTINPVQLVVIGATVWALTIIASRGFFKQIFNGTGS